MDKYNKSIRFPHPGTQGNGLLNSLGQIETRGGMARASASLGAAATIAAFVVWLLLSLSSISHEIDKNNVQLIELEKGVDHLAGKLDMALSRLASHPIGGFQDNPPHGGSPDAAAGAGSFSHKLDQQLQRLAQGVQAVDTLKTRLESMSETLAKGELAAQTKCDSLLQRVCQKSGYTGGGGGGGGGDTEGGRVARDAVHSENHFGAPARLPGEKQDPHASEALSQQTLQMKPGDALPMVGKAYHPWFSNSDHSKKTTYVHLLKDKWGAKRKCKYVDVVFWQKVADRCLMVVPDREIRSRTVAAELDMETGIAKPRPKLRRDTNPLDIKIRDERYWNFAQAKDEMVTYLRVLLGTEHRAARLAKQANPEPLVVMCLNEGHLGLLLNWACSLRAAAIKMPKHVIFCTSASTRDFLKELGFLAYYHNKIGKYPKQASAKYSDPTFGQMMIMKQVAVSLSLESGYDVLFQDIDITWLKDPRPELLEQAEYYEAQFQDDGARNRLYQPWYANTGFFYLRGTYIGRDLWDRVTMQMPSWPQSNQVVLNWVMEGYESRGNPVNNAPLAIRVLPQDEYAAGNGVDLPGAKNPGQSTTHFDVRPLSPTAKVVHFCWTHNITFKIQKMRAYRSLYVSEECLMDWEKCVESPSSTWADDVCLHTDLPPMAPSYEAWLKKH
mmetsp:Transcript_22359/g.67215  ORF Transcript_22359/g.67215 Transcript_22359/m.67215 type:complete len:669 (+) Transcript_22359:144-2150(+)